MFSRRSACLLAVLGCAIGAGAARAQDSVSTAGGLPGDAPDAYQNTSGDTRQQLAFVVDLTPKSSSWGGQFALGPAVKASKSNAGGYFDQLIGAQCLSARFLGNAPFSSAGSYSLWSGAPGAGVNPPQNSTPAQTIGGAGRFGQRFGLAFMEFGAGLDGVFGSGDDENSLIGALIDFQFRQPNRLFVNRIVADTNKSTPSASGTASFGIGGIDESGNLHAYADGYSMVVSTRLQTRALIRTKLAARNPLAVNQIQGSGSFVIAGDSAAVDSVRTNIVMQTVPGIISANLPGGAGRPVLLSTDLVNNFIYESGANTTSTSTTYLGSTQGPRGSISFIPQVYAPVASASPAGTAATLARTDSNTRTRAIQVFGVSTTGSVGTPVNLTLPASAGSLVDADDAFSPGASFSPITDHEFTNYASQASFRGGSSQVAMTQLAGGDLLVAATVAANGGGSAVPQTQDNYIAVARLPAAGGSPVWTIAAHTGANGFAGSGAGVASKTIYGRAGANDPLTPIGRLAKYSEVYGAASTGPSISSPAFDRAGNIYFIAGVGLTGASTTFTTGLLRANFNPSTNAYQLELIAGVGDVVAGANSGKNYQIQFLGVADADSVDSGSIFSNSTVQDSIAGANAAAAPYASPLSLGALVFRAKIVYDMNDDGIYADPSGAGSGSTSPDQAYNVAMVLMPRIPRGDFNRDQLVQVADIFAFLNTWFASSPGADWNGDGTVTVQDIFEFLNDWFTGG
ncbi:MAG TPA: GC-type dockerin domain-anchored protein [Phycisphaerales bacterium]|nr:GC-type dockerin domain-anchored protein [Phycisphaerales bacterium]